MNRLRPLLVNLALSAATTLVGLAVLEGGARLFEKKRPAAPVADYIWDWHEHMEGGDFYTIRSEGTGWPPWEDFNADGLRDRTHPLEKPEGGRRVVMLGDSVTLGDQIRPTEAFPQALEARLLAEGRPVEVMNVALWGWSTRQERIAYGRLVRKYRPDTVLLAVCLNDIPELQNNLSQPPAWLAGLFRRSALVRRVTNAEGREIQSVEQLFTNAGAPRVRQAMARFFEEVRLLRNDVESDGAGFAMLVFPFRFQVLPGAPPPSVQQELAAFCAAEHLGCLDLLPAIRPAGEPAFVDYDHLSPPGARLAAETILASGLLPPVAAYPEVLARRLGASTPTVAQLVATLSEKEAPLRAAAVWALGQRAAEARAAAPALVRALRDPAEPVRALAATALGAVGAEAGAAPMPTLFAALEDPSEHVRWAAAGALFRLRPRAPDDLPALTLALDNRDVYVRSFAAFTIGEMGEAAREAVPALVAALAREDGYGRGGASTALAKMGPAAAAAVPALVDGLKSTDGDRRWKAARTLGRIGPAASPAVPALLAALAADANERVRANAARALGRIAPAQSADGLRRAGQDPDESVRKEVAEALGRVP